MNSYELIWPLLRLLPAETAHTLGGQFLRLPLPPKSAPETTPQDAYEWNGLKLKNRVGIAAGFDKNGMYLNGLARMEAGFVEVGTILVDPWGGNPQPRLDRVIPQKAVWNRLGFPSIGVAAVKENLKQFVSRRTTSNMRIACNIGPHPGHVKLAKDPADYLRIAREELVQLVDALHTLSDLFVVNLSSPNTKGLRNLLLQPELAADIFRPIYEAVRRHDSESGRKSSTPVLVKLPPEDPQRELWTEESLRPILEPLFSAQVCDGIVAVNTSTRLTIEILPNPDVQFPGGISGEPLRKYALQMMPLLRKIVGQTPLIVGSGGVMKGEHAAELIQAGANIVELYSGLVYRGPQLITDCVKALRS